MNLMRAVLQLNLLSIWKREMRVWGYSLTPSSLDRLTCLTLHRLGLMGKEEKAAFQRWIRPGMTVVDAGANQGLYALLFSGLVGPSGAVLAFEPEPDMFASLIQNCQANSASNIQCFELALGSTAGTGTLHRSLVHGGDNRIAVGLSEKIAKSIEIKIATLDEVVGTRKVDFLKMDVQGWEWEVFNGMDQVLRNNQNLQIYFEFWPQGLKNAGSNPSDLLTFLISRGFRLSRMLAGREVALEDSTLGQSWKGQRFTNIYARR
jgi:FkbM family methyltransferase